MPRKPLVHLSPAVLVEESWKRWKHLTANDHSKNPETGADKSERTNRDLLIARVAEVLMLLTPRERQVIEMRFGLKDDQPRSLEEVGRAYGITRERIRQIEARCLLKLEQPWPAGLRELC